MSGRRQCPEEPFCTADLTRTRHNHVLPQLNAIGENCWTCKLADWRIWYGGTLPALIRCGGCGAGFNLTERLRQTTSPERLTYKAV
jgi:hypothetical protein